MRIVGLVCYFLVLFYGVELVIEELAINEPANISSKLGKQPIPLKETVENSTVCVYYPTYKECTALSNN
ncbi:hypothetical protein [Lysinibacillus pakistanensis]|uniref:Uncharacterized protein n=1 Tax=Lysinibacillus pakistanensis TaxID=759811 RepID=A0AAX3WT53_9BACI|nr:hypothetical protein [Lysinibacillus pakistanensis]MDM5233936.1 hypothetical protein [Lysinibacillus pakistanensis]WHY44544.1 hypothetical protein QNH22_14545 [Lysinibacillus pakistanensis]WHY49552.1 hypothetical protein QNH24_14520 [Lysinibacillus pakistanensis]